MAMDLLQQLSDIEDIKKVKAQLYRSLDAKDWDAVRACFADDATFDLMDDQLFDAPDAFVAAVRERTAGATTVHHGHMPEIEIDSETEAHGLWALADYLEWDADPATGERRGMKGYGRETETYRKVDGAWRIASVVLRYIRIDALPREPLPGQIQGGPDLLREGDEYAQIIK
jgi:hypothetical protein